MRSENEESPLFHRNNESRLNPEARRSLASVLSSVNGQRMIVWPHRKHARESPVATKTSVVIVDVFLDDG
jgi:hypothetical protein